MFVGVSGSSDCPKFLCVCFEECSSVCNEGCLVKHQLTGGADSACAPLFSKVVLFLLSDDAYWPASRCHYSSGAPLIAIIMDGRRIEARFQSMKVCALPHIFVVRDEI